MDEREKRTLLSDLLMSTEARHEFGLSRDMMTKLLANGMLPYVTDPLDKRIKWVKRGDVEEVVARSHKGQRAAPVPATERGDSDHGQRPNRRPPAHAPLPSPPPPPPLTHQADTGAKQLKPSDRAVLDFLSRLCAATGTDCTPPVGYRTIAGRCGISPRQAQICGDRLVAARRIERLRHDSGHPDLTQRGMVYRVLVAALLSS